MTVPKSFVEQKRIKLTFKNQDVIDVDHDGDHSRSLSITNIVKKISNSLSLSCYHLKSIINFIISLGIIYPYRIIT